jgi:DNA/RNA-binding domain of Phe-tRNA-synthetase-like protein
MTTIFRYDPAILERYPDIVGGVIHARGVANGPTPPALWDAYAAEQAATLARIGVTPLSQLPALAAWRAAFRAFGLDPTQYRCAAEALLRRLTKSGSIPNLNALVDLGNLVSIRYALPVAIFDRRAATGATTVRFATGSERFTPLGQAEPEHPVPGEVIFSDDADLVSARRWCWRQSAESAARDDTTTILITVEAQHPGGRADVEAALCDLLALLPLAADGKTVTAVLDREHPTFEV